MSDLRPVAIDYAFEPKEVALLEQALARELHEELGPPAGSSRSVRATC